MGGLFGAKTPKLPKPAPPVRMPDQDDPAAKAAKLQAERQRAAAGGRSSTILANDRGSGSLADTKLGT